MVRTTDTPTSAPRSAPGNAGGCELFAGMDADQVAAFDALTSTSRHRRGTTIHGPHDRPDRLYLVRSGSVRLLSADADGRTLTVAIVDAGAAFGERALLGDPATGVRAEAVEDCVVASISICALRHAMDRFPVIGLNLLALVGRRLRHADEFSHRLAYWSVDRRLAHQLELLADAYGRPTLSGDVIVDRCFTQAELAAMIGATRQSVSESLATLTRKGVVDRRRRRIVIRDRSALAHHAGRRAPARHDPLAVPG